MKELETFLKTISDGKKKEGVATAALIKTTGFNAPKLAHIIYKAKKRRMIQTVRKGVYAEM
ncbi:MAG: hypothetical protein ACOZF0_19535 [Thermodesulfobacteriota bacterium]